MESGKNIKKKLRGAYITTTISITLVIFLLGLSSVILLNANEFTNYLKANIGFSVFLSDSLSNTQAGRLQNILEKKEYVASTLFCSKEKAAQELKEELGEDFEKILGENPLNPSIEVTLKQEYANTDSIKNIKTELEKFSEVTEIVYERPLIDTIQHNLKKISLFAGIFAIILLIISIILINNTIRLSIYSQRFIINTLQLVGATQTFIRKPYIIKATKYGIISSLIAICLLIGILLLIPNEINTIFSISGFLIILFLQVLIGGIISGSAAWISVNRYLQMDTDQLNN